MCKCWTLVLSCILSSCLRRRIYFFNLVTYFLVGFPIFPLTFSSAIANKLTTLTLFRSYFHASYSITGSMFYVLFSEISWFACLCLIVSQFIWIHTRRKQSQCHSDVDHFKRMQVTADTIKSTLK